MASISRDPNGRRRILFVDRDGGRKAIRLGKVPQRLADEIKIKVEALKAAVRADLLHRNPFDDLKAAGNPNKERQRFISREDTLRVLDACPDAEWRLIVALSRYGGLRCPSEHLSLAWPDVDWERGRF